MYAYTATVPIARIQPATSDRSSLLIATSSVCVRIEIVPPSPMSLSSTPCSPRKAASVTTNDGMPSRATNSPMKRPITAPVARQPRIATHHGQPQLVAMIPMTAAAVPAA